MTYLGKILQPLLILLWIFQAIATPLAHADPIPTQVELIWVDARGSVLKIDWPTRTRWIWKSVASDGTSPIRVPVIRTWIELPDGVKVEELNTLPADFTDRPSDSPFGENGHVIAFDQQNTVMSNQLNIVDAQGKKTSIGLVIRLIVERPVVLVDPSCQPSGFNLKDKIINAPHLYVAAFCKEDRGDLGVYLFHSMDSEWKGSSLGKELAKGSNWLYYKIHVGGKPHLLVGAFRVGRAGDQNFSEYVISLDILAPEYQGSRFSFSGDLGTSVLVYTESGASNVGFTELGLTGKFNAGYELIRRRLDLGFNVFATLLPLTNNNNPPVYSARWYGINGRVGYRLPLDLNATTLSLMAGWYFWGMIVPPCQGTEGVCPGDGSGVGTPPYGVASLNGPQTFIRIRRAPIGKRPYAFYVKFALIEPTAFSFIPSDREIAFGGSYQLSAPSEHKPFTLSADISQAQFQDDSHALNLRSFSVSVGKSF